jgi:hypothetical protein
VRFQEFAADLKESGLDVDPHGLPQNYFGPSQDYPVPKSLPDVPVDLPDQYRADRNVLIYDGMIWNAMTAPVYRAMQKSPAVFDREIVPAGKIRGISGQIMIAQHNGVNYFLTNDMARNLQQEVKTADLANRNRSVQSRMARGDKLSAMPTGEIDGTKPTAGTTDRGSVRDPEQQFDLPVRKI